MEFDWLAFASYGAVILLSVGITMLFVERRKKREGTLGGVKNPAWERLIDRIMPNVWLVYALWFAGNCVVTVYAPRDSLEIVVGLWSAFGGSIATFSLTIAKQRGPED